FRPFSRRYSVMPSMEGPCDTPAGKVSARAGETSRNMKASRQASQRKERTSGSGRDGVMAKIQGVLEEWLGHPVVAWVHCRLPPTATSACFNAPRNAALRAILTGAAWPVRGH